MLNVVLSKYSSLILSLPTPFILDMKVHKKMFYTADQLEVEMLKSTEFEMHGVPEWFHNRTKSPFQKQNTRFYLTHLCVLIEYCSITLPKNKDFCRG